MSERSNVWLEDRKYVLESLSALQEHKGRNDQTLAELSTQTEVQTEILERVEKCVGKIEHSIEGNGKPGLRSRIDDLERERAERERRDAEAKAARDRRVANISRAFWLVVAPALTALGTLFVFLSVKLFHVLTAIQQHQLTQ